MRKTRQNKRYSHSGEVAATAVIRLKASFQCKTPLHMIDITMSHPLCSTLVHRVAQFNFASGEHSADQKKEKYKALAQRYQCKFLAMFCETFGGSSES